MTRVVKILTSHERAVLIIAYRRAENLNYLLDFCINQGVSRIYVGLDGPKNEDDQVETDKCRKVLSDFMENHPENISSRVLGRNVGAAEAVLTAVNWAFETETFLVVVEDDCIPNNQFFDFVYKGKEVIEQADDCLLVCGTQFAPFAVTNGEWALCSYPLIWGWATSKLKWVKILASMDDFDNSRRFQGLGSLAERSFWYSGARRSYQGYIDAWDLPMVYAIRKMNGLALVPGINLVSNVGDDSFATHTSRPSQWLNLATGVSALDFASPVKNLELDSWLRNNFYRIRSRHLVTNYITEILDFLGFFKRKRRPLLERIKLKN